MTILKIVYIILQINFALSEDVLFHLYNRHHPTKFQIINNDWDCRNCSEEYKFIIHGFTSNAKTKWIIDMKNEYLKKYDYNIIAVEWSSISGTNFMDYPGVVIANIEHVAKMVANLILNLKTKGIKLRNIHLIGQSLGAHIAGSAGKLVAANGKKIGRITGLDPAGPGFNFFITHLRISQGDADFVDIIHTSKILGYKDNCGDCDFYVNDGYLQNGCLKELFLDLVIRKKIDSCSHARAYKYFTESIQRNPRGFIATQCNSYGDYKKKKCSGNHVTSMGEHVSPYAKGTYHLQTKDEYPFAKHGVIDNLKK